MLHYINIINNKISLKIKYQNCHIENFKFCTISGHILTPTPKYINL